MTGHQQFEAERDVMRKAAADAKANLEARPPWHIRLGQLLDALAGVELTDQDRRFLSWIALGEGSTRGAIGLIERIRRGAYPELELDDDDQAPLTFAQNGTDAGGRPDPAVPQ